MTLNALFRPRSIAIVGASQNQGKVGGMPVRLLRELGYAGRVYAINSSATEVQGLRAYSNVTQLPEPVDLAIVAVPSAGVEQAISDLARAGTGAAVVLSSGFAEIGEEGVLAQERIAGVARSAGMALLGPNCLGVMNIRERMFATFSHAPLAGLPMPGCVAIVSQSGAFGAYAFSLACQGGLGLSHWVTTGNEAGLSVADVIDWLAGDPETRIIAAYIEGARDGRKLQCALEKARAAGKCVIVTKVGRTEAGARAAMSHTASLSGEDAVYQAVFDDSGAIRAQTVGEMFRLAQAFSTLPRPAGNRLAIVTISGGVGALMADSAAAAGLDMPPLPEDLSREMRAKVPFCSTANPLDVTGQVTSDFDVLELATLGAARSNVYDAMAIFLAAAAASPIFASKVLRAVLDVRAAVPEMPVVISGIIEAPTQVQLLAAGCLVYEEPTHAVEVLAAMARWASFTGKPGVREAKSLSVAKGALNEVDGMAFLARHGVPSCPHLLVHSPDDAVAAWRKLGGKAVLKIVSADLQHKSDVGGVKVGLRSESDIREAYGAVLASVTRLAPDARQEGVLVSRQLEPLVEVMLGARYDPIFGPIIVVGFGGVAVELHARTAVLTAPTSADRVRTQLDTLGILKLLGGWRGKPAVDEQPLVESIVRFSELAASLGSGLGAMEVNPFMVTVDGVAAADAVVCFI